MTAAPRPSWIRFKRTLRLELARTRAALQPRALLAALRTRFRTARESFTAELGRGGEQPRDSHKGRGRWQKKLNRKGAKDARRRDRTSSADNAEGRREERNNSRMTTEESQPGVAAETGPGPGQLGDGGCSPDGPVVHAKTVTDGPGEFCGGDRPGKRIEKKEIDFVIKT